MQCKQEVAAGSSVSLASSILNVRISSLHETRHKFTAFLPFFSIQAKHVWINTVLSICKVSYLSSPHDSLLVEALVVAIILNNYRGLKDYRLGYIQQF